MKNVLDFNKAFVENCLFIKQNDIDIFGFYICHMNISNGIYGEFAHINCCWFSTGINKKYSRSIIPKGIGFFAKKENLINVLGTKIDKFDDVIFAENVFKNLIKQQNLGYDIGDY